MWRLINLGLVLVVIVGAAVTFDIKHRAELAEEEVARLQRQIKLESETLDLLKADWAYLNNVQRLQSIVSAFKDELELRDVATDQLITFDELPDYVRNVVGDAPGDMIADALEDLDGVTTGTAGVAGDAVATTLSE